ncbi:hypothetical protein ACWDYH_34145 [Nocardia goodfellowii]
MQAEGRWRLLEIDSGGDLCGATRGGAKIDVGFVCPGIHLKGSWFAACHPAQLVEVGGGVQLVPPVVAVETVAHVGVQLRTDVLVFPGFLRFGLPLELEVGAFGSLCRPHYDQCGLGIGTRTLVEISRLACRELREKAALADLHGVLLVRAAAGQHECRCGDHEKDRDPLLDQLCSKTTHDAFRH